MKNTIRLSHTWCLPMQAGDAPTEDVERDWQRMERERTQLLDMKQQVIAYKPTDYIHRLQSCHFSVAFASPIPCLADWSHGLRLEQFVQVVLSTCACRFIAKFVSWCIVFETHVFLLKTRLYMMSEELKTAEKPSVNTLPERAGCMICMRMLHQLGW